MSTKIKVKSDAFIDWMLQDDDDVFSNIDWIKKKIKRRELITADDFLDLCGYIPNDLLVEPTEDDDAEFDPDECEIQY